MKDFNLAIAVDGIEQDPNHHKVADTFKNFIYDSPYKFTGTTKKSSEEEGNVIYINGTISIPNDKRDSDFLNDLTDMIEDNQWLYGGGITPID